YTRRFWYEVQCALLVSCGAPYRRRYVYKVIMVEKLKKLFEFCTKQNFVVRYMFFTLLGTFGGATYIGKLSELATYYYAWDNNFIVPVEGVPYLKLTIFGASFSVILFTILLFTAIYMFGHFLFIYVKNHSDGLFGLSVLFFKMMTKNHTTVTAMASGLIASLIITFIVFIMPYFDDSITMSRWISVPLSLVGSFVTFMVLWNKKTLLAIAIFISLSGAFIVPYVLFNSTIYADLINNLGYGGGLLVDIETANKSYLGSELLLRTSESVIIKGSDFKTTEIPISKINHIVYK
ncbi:hypothetical protein ACQKP8_27095, partial [Photobacterium alginatilyticum]